MNHDDAAPSIILDAKGFYWRNYPDHLSMVPTTDDNLPVEKPWVMYWPVGEMAADGTFTQQSDICRMPTQEEAAEWLANYCSDSIDSDRETYMQEAGGLLDWLVGLAAR